METMTQKDRLLKFKDYLGMSVRSFESQIGVSNGYFKSLNRKPGARVLEQIFKAFPSLNRMWVLTGDGDMLIHNSGNTSISTVEIGSNNTGSSVDINGDNSLVLVLREQIDILKNRIASLEAQVSSKDKQISSMQDTINKLMDRL